MAKGEIFKGLPEWSRGVLAVAGAAAVVFVGYKVYQKVKQDYALKGSKDQLSNQNKELDILINKGARPSLTPAQSSVVANNLFQIMNDATYNSFWGTPDSKKIYAEIAKLKNDADVLLVQRAFGTKKIRRGAFTADFEGTLSSAFTSLLSTDVVNAINGMLAKKGIKYRF